MEYIWRKVMAWPFNLTPRGILLEGKDRERAKARYELSGEELDRALLAIDYNDKESREYKKAALELDKKYAKISDLEYAKQIATLNDEPWVAYKDYGLEETNGHTGFWFEFDWNDIFLRKLREEGYEGTTDEMVVRKWYAELCRTVALEEGLALDLFGEEGEETGQGIRKKFNDDGTVNYS